MEEVCQGLLVFEARFRLFSSVLLHGCAIPSHHRSFLLRHSTPPVGTFSFAPPRLTRIDDGRTRKDLLSGSECPIRHIVAFSQHILPVARPAQSKAADLPGVGLPLDPMSTYGEQLFPDVAASIRQRCRTCTQSGCEPTSPSAETIEHGLEERTLWKTPRWWNATNCRT